MLNSDLVETTWIRHSHPFDYIHILGIDAASGGFVVDMDDKNNTIAYMTLEEIERDYQNITPDDDEY